MLRFLIYILLAVTGVQMKGRMKYDSDHIKELCDELIGLGIPIDSDTMKLIIKMQEDDFFEITKEIDTDLEYKKIINRINSGKSSHFKCDLL
jgi:hypothetical protein